MRVLHLTPELPFWPGGAGGSTRQFHLLRRLAELEHEVRVVAPIREEQEPHRDRLRDAGIALDAAPRPPSRVAESLRALAREPRLAARGARLPVLAWQVSVFWTSLRPVARRVAQEWQPDVVTVEHDNAAAWALDMPNALPAVLTLQNVSWSYYEARARAARGVGQLAYGIEARRFRRHDLRALHRYRALIAVSERDREELLAASDRPVQVVPNGVATDELPAQPSPLGPPTLVFTGTLNHPPNSEGICWFVDAVWPRVRARRPDATLLVVGRDPPPQVRALAGRGGVDVVGPVPDMAPYFARSTGVVVPLRSGGGTRLKVLEALASGRALVSTSIGCEGLELEPDRHLLVADEPDAFADAALALVEDPSLRERLAGAGRARARERYDWRTLGERLAGVLQQAAFPRARS